MSFVLYQSVRKPRGIFDKRNIHVVKYFHENSITEVIFFTLMQSQYSKLSLFLWPKRKVYVFVLRVDTKGQFVIRRSHLSDHRKG